MNTLNFTEWTVICDFFDKKLDQIDKSDINFSFLNDLLQKCISMKMDAARNERLTYKDCTNV